MKPTIPRLRSVLPLLLLAAGCAGQRAVPPPAARAALTCTADPAADDNGPAPPKKGNSYGVGNNRVHGLAVQAGAIPGPQPVNITVSLLRDDIAGVNIRAGSGTTTLNRPALLTLSVAGCEIPEPYTFDDIIVVQVQDTPPFNVIGPVGGDMRDRARGTVSVFLPHFSAYALAVP